MENLKKPLCLRLKQNNSKIFKYSSLDIQLKYSVEGRCSLTDSFLIYKSLGVRSKFLGGGRGGGWGGGSSEGCLKWCGGGWGSLRDLSKTSKNRGWVKARVVHRGEGGGFEGVTTPAPPENFNHTLVCIQFLQITVIFPESPQTFTWGESQNPGGGYFQCRSDIGMLVRNVFGKP